MEALQTHKPTLALQTALNYTSLVKKHLIRRGLIVNPNFARGIVMATMDGTAKMDSAVIKVEMKKAVDYEQSEPYEQYRLWKALKGYGEEQLTPFERAVKGSIFYTLDFQLNAKYMGIDRYKPDARKIIEKKARSRLEEKLQRPKFISEAQSFMEFILSGLYSPDRVTDMLPGLALASGRRHCSFYINTDNFRRGSGRDAYDCEYTEIVKKRSKKQALTFRIPLLCPWWLFKTCLNRFTRLINTKYGKPFTTSQESNNKRSYIDNKHLRHRIGTEWTMRDLRHMYIALTLKIHADRMQQNAFVQAVLGHENIQQSLTYTGIILDPLCKITQPVFKNLKTPDRKMVVPGTKVFTNLYLHRSSDHFSVSELGSDDLKNTVTLDFMVEEKDKGFAVQFKEGVEKVLGYSSEPIDMKKQPLLVKEAEIFFDSESKKEQVILGKSLKICKMSGWSEMTEMTKDTPEELPPTMPQSGLL